jgi:hypothetical protein
VTDPKRIPLEPANELEGVMVQVAAGSREEAAFFERLYNSELLVPQTGPPGEVTELPAEPGAEIGLPVLPAHGQKTVPVYSSEAQMRKKAPPEWSRFVRLGMPALQQMLAGRGVHLLINPGGDLSTILDPAQIAALPEDHPPAQPLPGDATIQGLAANEVPDDLLSPLRAFCAGQPAIRAAYAAELDGRLAIGLLLAPGVSQAAVMREAEAALGTGVPPFAMAVIDDEAPGRLGAAMLAGRPVYER